MTSRDSSPPSDRGEASRSWRAATAYLRALEGVDPDAAAALGRQPESLLPDLSPEGMAARHQVDLDALAALPETPTAEVLDLALRERLQRETSLYESGFTPALLAPLATPVHRLRQVFDDLPRSGDDDWRRIARHLTAAAQGYGDYAETLRQARADGARIARRQALVVADQVATWVDPDAVDFYRSLVRDHIGSPVLADELARAAERASEAAQRFATFLRTELAPAAEPDDGVGPDLYAVTSAAFLGATTDPAELYEYGWSELARLTAEATNLAVELTGERDLTVAREVLDRRVGARVAVVDLVEWLGERLSAITGTLRGRHFDLPTTGAEVEARMVTAPSGVMYYGAPDPAGTRPGRVWWAVPPGTESVATWREVSTVHHEGLPGHHLQHVITHAVSELHPWQRYLCHIHGYAEGWAHYSEQLAVDLGLVRGDDELLGVYGAQLWRAARIVIDLGLHLGYPIPRGNGLTSATSWDPQTAARFLADVAGTDPVTAAWEVDRYLGWPGQALAFKVGAKLWTDARDEQRRTKGKAFDPKQFHMEALRLGPMGLDALRAALAGGG